MDQTSLTSVLQCQVSIHEKYFKFLKVFIKIKPLHYNKVIFIIEPHSYSVNSWEEMISNTFI